MIFVFRRFSYEKIKYFSCIKQYTIFKSAGSGNGHTFKWNRLQFREGLMA